MSQSEITLISIAESIDDLARMVKDGFDGVDKRLSDHDKRLDKIDGRLDKMDGRLDRIELLAFGDYRRRIERLEDEVFKQKSMAT